MRAKAHAPRTVFAPSRRGFIIAAIVAPTALAAACSSSDETDSVIRLGNDGFAPPVDDIQDNSTAGSDVDLDFTTFDGSTANLSAYAGTPLVINFFARTCAPCVAEMPEFETVFQEFGGAVAFLGISLDARLDDARDLVEQTGVTYDLGWDPGSDLFRNFGGFAMPTTVFVTSAGTINEVWAGALTAGKLTDKINELT